MEDKCAVCAAEACQRCVHCGVIGYCGKEHEKQDWATHKSACHPYKIEVSDLLGRYVEQKLASNSAKYFVTDISLRQGI